MNHRLLIVALLAICLMAFAALAGCSAGMVDSISDRARIVSVTYDSNVSGGPSGNLVEARNVPRDATLTVVVHPRHEWYLKWWVWTLVRDDDGGVREEYLWFRYSVDKNNFERTRVQLLPTTPTPLLRANTTYKVLLNLTEYGDYNDNDTADSRVFLFSTGEQIDFDLFSGRPGPAERGLSLPFNPPCTVQFDSPAISQP